MKIEVWSDFVCPFCYIGKRRLEQALEQFEHRDEVVVEFKSFELDPNTPLYAGQNIHQVIAKKYGMQEEQARRNNDQLGQQALAVGLKFDFDGMKPTNTFDAHRLFKYAQAQGNDKVLTEKLLHAYFTEGRLISDMGTLAEIAEQSGIDRAEAERVLHDKSAYETDVRADEQLAAQFGITGVPFFIINRKYAISGAQPLETFASALKQIWEEENAGPVLQQFGSGGQDDAAICTDTECAVPPKAEE